MARKILVTSALPYANGDIHLGHLVEYIQTDIWVRFLKMQGHECYYVCADDTHGTPIMLRAEKEGITPEQLIEKVWHNHYRDFKGFHINFDNYYSTNSDENWLLSQHIYKQLKANDLIAIREIEQLYDPEKNMFLPDRFIKGECPKCHAKDQYGDSCEVCGTTYQPTDLINPYSAVSGAKPILKTSEHHFFTLGKCQDFLSNWVNSDQHLQPEAANKMREWIDSGLQDWDISRDAPYFGFEIPDAPGKYFYVWLDAPIGYMASFMKFCSDNNMNFNEFWSPDAQTELYHFIGKDILYFHALFWTSSLKFSGFRTPNKIFAHGFLTVNGQKMSKSRGTFITAESYLKFLNPEHLRYYFSAKLTNKIEDIDLSLDDFTARVNSDLIGKFINIASRTAGFVHKYFDGKLAGELPENTLIQAFQSQADSIAHHFEEREYSKAIREIMALADQVNQYFDVVKPWELAKQPERHGELHQICTLAINLFRILTIYLKPVLPQLAEQVESFLIIDALKWSDSQSLLLNHTIQPYKHLMQRIDPKQIQALIEANQSSL